MSNASSTYFQTPSLAGAVICGGKSRRMGADKLHLTIELPIIDEGGHKAVAIYQSTSLLFWAVRRLHAATNRIALSGSQDSLPKLAAQLASSLCPDQSIDAIADLTRPESDALSAFLDPNLGPIGGLAACLEWADQSNHDWLITIPVDVPLVPIRVILALAEICTSRHQPHLAPTFLATKSDRQGLCAIWPVKPTLSQVQTAISNDSLSIHGLLDALDAKPLDLSTMSLSPSFIDVALMNVNTPEDYERAKAAALLHGAELLATD